MELARCLEIQGRVGQVEQAQEQTETQQDDQDQKVEA
jgi:hypothetical protein